VIHFDDRRHGALPKAGNGAHRELAVGSSEQKLVGFAPVVVITIQS
jgi:hypothetical protein